MDTSGTELEKIIDDWLMQHNGYEQEIESRNTSSVSFAM
jgi:hypothetical protein